MASKKGGKCKRSYYQAKLVTNIGTCVFCQRAIDDEIIYGKLYVIGDIQCHYFCALLSCCLVQKGNDEEGLFGFLYHDILAEVERSKKHRCSYCNREGANLGCSVTQCRKQFHLPCGRERDAVSLFYGNYKSFCAKHAPKQKIADSIIPNVRMRIAEKGRQKHSRCLQKFDSQESRGDDTGDTPKIAETLCVICYEQVEGYPTPRTFWPPCCSRDAWFHRRCLQHMALSAGMHYLRCPLCNDKDEFYKAVVNQGYYVPDRDAAWELEQNAFAEIYERSISCNAEACKCPAGRDHDSDNGAWNIKLCILCGSSAIHPGCIVNTEEIINIYICKICKPAAPGNLEKLIASIEKVQLQEQAAETVRHGPVMPSRMSLRRTKQRPPINNGPSSSRNLFQNQSMTTPDNIKVNTEASRLELNLKKPVRRIFDPAVKNIDNILISPIKMLEQGLSEKMEQLHCELVVDSSKVLEKLRQKLKKPRPLVAKKRIVNTILDELLNSMFPDPKSKEAFKEWNSPKKTFVIKTEDCKEIIEDITPINKNTTEENPWCDIDNILNIKPVKSLQYANVTTEREEVCKNNDFRSNYKHKHIEMTSDSSKLHTAIDFAFEAYKNNKRKLSLDDTVPKKKQKIIRNINRKPEKNSTEKEINLEAKQSDFTEATANAEFEKIKEKDVEGHEKETIEKDACDIDKTRLVDNKDEALQDPFCCLKSKFVDDSVESISLEIENSKPHFAETKVNMGYEKNRILDKCVAEFKTESIEKNDSDIDTGSNDNNELKPIGDTFVKKKMINCSLNRKSENKSAKEETHLEMDNNKSNFAEITYNVEFKDINEYKDVMKELNKDVIYKDREVDKRTVGDKVIQDIKRRKIKNRKRNEGNHHLKNKNEHDKRSKRVLKGLNSENKLIDVTLNANNRKLKLKYKNKHKKKLSIHNKDIKVKIKWKMEQFKLKIMGKKEKKKRKLKERKLKVYKQYVLKYSPELTSPKDMIMRPDSEVTPVKRKYVKSEKQGDNMVQTNISNFFKVTPKIN